MIRQFQSNDLNDIMTAWRKANALAHPFLDPTLVQTIHDMIRDQFVPISDIWVAEDNGRVVGFIALLGNQVGGLFLDPAQHGKGIGRALMDKATTLHAELLLEVFKDNAIGRQFYDRYGFETIEEAMDDFTGHPVLRLRYTA